MAGKENYGIGVDIEAISRFSKLNRQKNKIFLNRIFTKQELDYCYADKNYASHLAARWAAKEAVVKALSALGVRRLTLKNIEIKRRSFGAPQAVVRRASKNIVIAISLAHSQDMAIAFAFAQKV